MMPPDRPMDPKLEARAKRRAKAVADRLQRDIPLFVAAGIVQAPTIEQAAEQVQARDEEMAAHLLSIEAHQRASEARGLEIRAALAARVSADRIAVLDKARAGMPSTYGVSFWHKAIREEPRVRCPECEPLIAKLHEAERAFYMRDSMATMGVVKREADAKVAMAAHNLEAHGIGPGRFQQHPRCGMCRNYAEVLDMRERDEAEGFPFPGALADARENYSRHMAWHETLEREQQSEPLPEK